MTITTILTNTNDSITSDVSLGGTFVFRGTSLDKCKVSSNGYIYFFHDDFSSSDPTTNPLAIRAWYAISPFGGDLKTTNDGITINSDNTLKKCTITFNCYSNTSSTSNILIFKIIIYWDDHPTLSNKVDFVYQSSTSRTSGFVGNYYMGYSDGAKFRYISNADTPSIISEGNASVSSTNKFPEDGTIIADILSITPTSILKNADDGVAVDILIGGTFEYSGGSYNNCHITSNGIINFGEYGTSDTYNPFGYSAYRQLFPFSGNLKTTSDGVTVTTSSFITTITFNCYSNNTNTLNTLHFSVLLYLNGHANAGRVDYVYTSATSRTENFVGNYYVGYSHNNAICCQNMNRPSVYVPGSSYITSTNKFPENGTTVTDILNIDYMASGKYLINMDDDEYSVNIGGTFNFGGTNYTTTKITTNGFIYFGTGPASANYFPFTSDASWKVISAFATDLVTTLDGVDVIPDTINKKCTITFHCASYYISNNVFIFEIILYYTDHPTKANQIELHYVSANYYEGESYFTGNYTIGYSNGSVCRTVKNITSFEVSNSNAGESISTNVFPAADTTYIINQNDNTIKWKVNINWTPEFTTSYGNRFGEKQLYSIITKTGTNDELDSDPIVYKLDAIDGVNVNLATEISTGNHQVYALYSTDLYASDYATNAFELKNVNLIGSLLAFHDFSKGWSYSSKKIADNTIMITISWVTDKGRTCTVNLYKTISTPI